MKTIKFLVVIASVAWAIMQTGAELWSLNRAE